MASEEEAETAPESHGPDLEEGASTAERWGHTLGTAVAPFALLLFFALVLALPAGVIWGIIEAYPEKVPEKADPSVIDTIFESRSVLWGSRIMLLLAAVVLLFAGIYAVASVVVRINRKQWLRRAGPLEAELAEKLEETLEEDFDPLLESFGEALATNEDLERRLGESNEELEETLMALSEAQQQLQEARQEIERLGGRSSGG